MLEYGEGVVSNVFVVSFFEICILSFVKKRNNNVSLVMIFLYMLVEIIYR